MRDGRPIIVANLGFKEADGGRENCRHRRLGRAGDGKKAREFPVLSNNMKVFWLGKAKAQREGSRQSGWRKGRRGGKRWRLEVSRYGKTRLHQLQWLKLLISTTRN